MAFPDFLRRPLPPEEVAASVPGGPPRSRWQAGSPVPIDQLPWLPKAPVPVAEPLPEFARARWRFRFSPAEPDGPDQLPWRAKAAAPAGALPPAAVRPRWWPGYFTGEATGADPLAWRRQPGPEPTAIPEVQLRQAWLAPLVQPEFVPWLASRRGILIDVPPSDAARSRVRWQPGYWAGDLAGPDTLPWRHAVQAPALPDTEPLGRGAFRAWISTQLPVAVPGPFFFAAMDVWCGGFEQGDIKEG